MAVVLAAALAGAPSLAAAAACPVAKPTYLGNCGPTFVVPAWGDAGGWNEPSQYSTIQLADVNGDGRDELIGRNDQGLEIYWFDTTLGQWRPQVDANGVPQVLSDFATPPPGQASNPRSPAQPQFYSTIQAANLAGGRGVEVLARFWDGMRVYQYVPPPDNDINGGSWRTIVTGGPFSDADGYGDASLYSSIGVGQFAQGEPPLLFARQRAGTYGQPTVVFYGWDGLKLTQAPAAGVSIGARGLGVISFPDRECSQPSCYQTLRAGNLAPGGRDAPDDTAELMGRTGGGISLWDLDESGAWNWLNEDYDFTPAGLPPFADAPSPGPSFPYPDCPFSAGGASGPGSGDCLGSSPSYYETLQAADVDGVAGDELLARASDGLRVRKWVPGPSGGQWDVLPTLTALAGAASGVPAGLWGSIRTGDIDADGKREVLALDGKALQAWSYDPAAKAWSQLRPTTPLALGADPWLSDPEYHSTIRVGDVDGDRRDDVVARGPFGIRTWFYDRRGTGGWERYLADGYPAFAAPGEANAYAALTALAKTTRSIPRTAASIRDVWTQPTPPDTTTLSNLQTNLASATVANCTNQTQFAPPTYASCVPPAGITAADWTTVVNEVLGEAYDAQQVIEHFGDVETMRAGLFESESGSLPAIASDLQINGAAGTTTTFDLQGFFAGTAGIAASIAGVVPGGAELSAGLWIASELISMLPSASATANSAFQGTYDTLITKLATAQDEMAVALAAQRQQVLGDQSLLGLVGQLRSTGTWKPDTDGLQSASRQAFALQTYQALLPTMYNRYVVSNCTDVFYPSGDETDCSLPSGRFVTRSGANIIWLGPPAADPCFSTNTVTDCEYQQNPGTMPYGIANVVWGTVSPTCNYKPPNKNTLWTYGCSLGVPYAQGIVADGGGWTFTTESGDPEVVLEGGARPAPATVQATGARAGTSARAAQAGASARAAREVLAPLRFTGRVSLSRGVRLRRMRVGVDRLLFEHGRREELARSSSGRRLRPFALRHVRAGLFTSRRRGGPRVRLRLRPLDARGRARLDLTLSRVRTRDVRALCTVHPAGVHRPGRPLELETRLRVRDRGASGRVTMRRPWRCVRDRKGEFAGIRPRAARRPSARPGLTVRLQTPRVLASARRQTVLVTVANRRRGRSGRTASSLWNLRVIARAGGRRQTVRVKELRARRTRTLRFSVPVPRHAGRRTCVQVTATADSARPAGARRCARG